MALHLIPDDGAPHAPTGECGCGPHLERVPYAGQIREAYVHPDQRADAGTGVLVLSADDA